MGAAGGNLPGAPCPDGEAARGPGVPQLPLPVPGGRSAQRVGEGHQRGGAGGPGSENGAASVAEMGRVPGDFATFVTAAGNFASGFGMYLQLL